MKHLLSLCFCLALAGNHPPDAAWAECAQASPDRAIPACTSLIDRLAPDDPHRAMAYFDRGNALRARHLREQAMGPAPSSATASLDQAIADYSEAIRLRPHFAEAHVNRGIAWQDLGRIDQAIADYDAAIRLDAGLAEAWNNRALARLKANRPDLAKADFDQTIRLNKNYGNALILRALPSRVSP